VRCIVRLQYHNRLSQAGRRLSNPLGLLIMASRILHASVHVLYCTSVLRMMVIIVGSDLRKRADDYGDTVRLPEVRYRRSYDRIT
jgi:hypothetical protein